MAFQTARKTDEWQRVADSVNRVGSRQPAMEEIKKSDPTLKSSTVERFTTACLYLFFCLCSIEHLHHIKMNSELDRCLVTHFGLEQQKY